MEMFLVFDAARLESRRTDELNHSFEANMQLSGAQSALIMLLGLQHGFVIPHGFLASTRVTRCWGVFHMGLQICYMSGLWVLRGLHCSPIGVKRSAGFCISKIASTMIVRNFNHKYYRD